MLLAAIYFFSSANNQRSQAMAIKQSSLQNIAWMEEADGLGYMGAEARINLAYGDRIREISDYTYAWILLGIGILLISYGIYTAKSEQSTCKEMVSKSQTDQLIDIINKHKDVLLTKRNKLLFVDEYGIENTDDWDGEKKQFLDRVVSKEIAGKRALKHSDMLIIIDQVLNDS